MNAIAVYDIPAQSNIVVLIKYHYKTTVEGIHNVLALSCLAYGLLNTILRPILFIPDHSAGTDVAFIVVNCHCMGIITLQLGPYNNNKLYVAITCHLEAINMQTTSGSDRWR